MNVQILSFGHALPDHILSNQDLEQMVDTNDQWIVERTGIKERRIGDANQTTSDLCVEAAKVALDRSGISAEQLDLIIVSTVTPDMIFPATACLVQDRLGAHSAAAFDLEAGCTGFVYGLTVAEKFLKSAEYNYALVIGAEMLSRIIDYKDRNTCVLFGDAAGAAILGKGSSPGIINSYLGSRGSGGDLLCIPAGGAKIPASEESVKNRLHFMHMNGKEIFRFSTKIVMEISEKLLDMAGLRYEDVDLFVPHQANLRIIKTAMKHMNIADEKTLITIDRFANTSSASIPVALSLAEEDGKVKNGDLILIVAFGAGLTYGGALFRWGRN